MTIFVSREAWGAKPRKIGTTSINPTNGVTVHYEGSGWSWPWDHSTCAGKVRAMQADHMAPESEGGKGWSDIAYNYLGCPHDYLFEGRGADRRSSANGTTEGNATSFAVQGIWGAKSGNPPDNLKRAIRTGIDICRAKGHANNELRGHRDWKETSCPGDPLYAWVQQGCPLPGLVNEDDEMLSPEALKQISTLIDQRLAVAAQDGQPIHEMVQKYAAFNALHDDQIEAVTQDKLDDEASRTLGRYQWMKDWFNALNTKLNAIDAQGDPDESVETVTPPTA
jgi:hypothetical protein